MASRLSMRASIKAIRQQAGAVKALRRATRFRTAQVQAIPAIDVVPEEDEKDGQQNADEAEDAPHDDAPDNVRQKAWKAHRVGLEQAYRKSAALSQAQGPDRVALTSNRLYFKGLMPYHESPAPWSMTIPGAVANSQQQVQQDIERVLHSLCPQLRAMRMIYVFDQAREERDVLHAIAEFESPAAAREAHQVFQETTKSAFSLGAKKFDGVSWRYCGLAYEPEVFASNNVMYPAPPCLSARARLFNRNTTYVRRLKSATGVTRKRRMYC
mmetsp:Transcript_90486/g.158140  ORF Transcript_90486/g.158140 Transcript_90486/m.158140 type:complete len:269 (+) Transcript_90486:80-886(+)